MPTTRAALELSLGWQRHVMAASRDPQQKARCKAAIERLEDQLREADAGRWVTERDVWIAQLRKPGFLTEAVAAIQAAALANETKLTAEPWEIARAIGQMMEE